MEEELLQIDFGEVESGLSEVSLLAILNKKERGRKIEHLRRSMKAVYVDHRDNQTLEGFVGNLGQQEC